MKTKNWKTLIRIHFVVLAIAIVNAVIKLSTAYSLAGNIEFVVEIITVITGLILFFLYRKLSKYISFYFLIYPMVSFLLISGLILRGIFGVLIFSTLIFPIIPDQQEYKQDGIIIYTPFKGFMAPCCPYHIKERKLWIFEKNIGAFDSEEGPIDYKTIHIEKSSKEIVLTFETHFDKGVVKTKTISR